MSKSLITCKVCKSKYYIWCFLFGMQKIMEKKRGMKTRVQEEAIKGASNKKTPKKSESCLFYHGM